MRHYGLYFKGGRVRKLDFATHESYDPEEGDVNPRLKRTAGRRFNRLKSGFTKANPTERTRFLTLTTADACTLDINHSWDVLKLRISRAFVKRDGFLGFKLKDYYKLKTAEGNGVLHIIFRGRYIPQSWLSKTWSQIHGGSNIVYIEEVSKIPRLLRYLVGYLQSQITLRMSYGWKWLWLGYSKSWKHILDLTVFSWTRKSQGSMSHAISYLNSLLADPPLSTMQSHF